MTLRGSLLSREVLPFYLSLLALLAATLAVDAACICWTSSGSANGWAFPASC